MKGGKEKGGKGSKENASREKRVEGA